MIRELVVNEVIEWLPDNEQSDCKLQRILWINPQICKMVVIDLFNNKALPYWVEVEEVTLALNEGLAQLSSIESSYQLMREEDIPLAHREVRDKAWNIISSLVNLKEQPGIFDPSHRGSMVEKVSKEFNCHKSTLYRYLRRYWQGGQTINALLPNYHHCGAPGKQRTIGEKKTW